MSTDHALLSDCQGAALVGRDGCIDWWAAPRFDSPSIFASLLDPDAGHWRLAPAAAAESVRRYAGDSLVLETAYRCADGEVVVRDALVFAPGARGHEIGREVPHALVRSVEGISGTVRMRTEIVPRPEYGLVVPYLREREGWIEAVGGPQRLALLADADLDVSEHSARGEFAVGAGETVAFVLAATADPGPPPLSAVAALRDTRAGWESWAGQHAAYDGPFAADVRRGAIVLQALTYQPTGAIVAAVTTSLPERRGGDRNWDYRFAWLRDASLVARSLRRATCSDEPARYFRWMSEAATTCASADHVQVVFGLHGERDLAERELTRLAGRDGSRPVRVGNAAWEQTQLDALGGVLDVAWNVREEVAPFDDHVVFLLCELADRAARQWREPDSGIWERRDGERDYLFGKVGCWVALDRAVKLAPLLGAEDRSGRWARERDAMREELLERAWSEEAQAFSCELGSDAVDVGLLLLPLVGFVDATDERMRSTIAVIEQRLGQDGLLWRWEGAAEDEDGAFLPASLWLASCLARAGDTARAREIVERVRALGGELGLLAQGAVPGTGEPVGNLPLAMTHVALIEAADAIGRAERGDRAG